jgi:hypothetical protein
MFISVIGVHAVAELATQLAGKVFVAVLEPVGQATSAAKVAA